MDDNNLEYYVGENDIDSEEISLGDNSEFIEFELEAKAVFKRLAEDIYESPSAGIREPLTNSATAILRSIEEYGLTEESGVIEITLERDSDSSTLTIQDNGVGISEDELREVLAVIGRSANRDNPEVAGQFGMGFLALWMLVGMDGGFEMYTHSRRDGEDPISGVWKSGGFTVDNNGVLPNGFSDDQYGTRFDLPLRDSIEPLDVRDWVKTYAEWCRVPVLYEEYDSDGVIVYDDEYGAKQFEEQMSEEVPYLTVDTPYYRVVTGPEASDETILLDVPVQRNSSRLSVPFSSFDIRLKMENSVVVDGPHEGLLPVSENEYRQMDSKRQEKYIPQKQVSSADVVMPGPTGTRDKLSESSDFWSHIREEVWEEYYTRVGSLYQKVTTTEEIFSLSDADLQLLMHSVNELQEHNTSFATTVTSKTGVRMLPEFGEKLQVMTNTVGFAPRGRDNVSAKVNRTNQPVWQIEKNSMNPDGEDGEVFMGVSLNDVKAKVVWADNEYNNVVRVESTDEYEQYQELLGWKKLKDVKRDTIDEFDVPEEIRTQFVNENHKKTVNARKDPGEKTLTLHFGDGHTNTVKATAKTIKDEFEAAEEQNREVSFSYNYPSMLVLFPSNEDEKISDNYWLSDDRIAISSCSVSVYEYLKDVPNIHRFTEYLEQSKTRSVETSDGSYTIENIPDNIVYHVVEGEQRDLFMDEEIMNRVAEYLAMNLFNGGYRTPDLETVTYAPVTQDFLDKIRPSLEETPILVSEHSYVGNGNTNNIRNNTELYAYARLYNWKETEEMDVVTDLSDSLSNGGLSLINTLAQLHDNDIPPASLK